MISGKIWNKTFLTFQSMRTEDTCKIMMNKEVTSITPYLTNVKSLNLAGMVMTHESARTEASFIHDPRLDTEGLIIQPL